MNGPADCEFSMRFDFNAGSFSELVQGGIEFVLDFGAGVGAFSDEHEITVSLNIDSTPPIAQAPLPATRLDGRDVLGVISGRSAAPRRSLYFRYRNHSALRDGSWKIVRENDAAPWQLYDLGNDLGESRNLATQEPEVVRRLETLFESWVPAESPAQNFGSD